MCWWSALLHTFAQAMVEEHTETKLGNYSALIIQYSSQEKLGKTTKMSQVKYPASI